MLNPRVRGSLFSELTGLLENPRNRASFCLSTVWSTAGAEAKGATGLTGATPGSPDLSTLIRVCGSGLREGELSSLLGGVLKGETFASKEGRRASGFRPIFGGKGMVVGLAGIFGLSARLTGGGGFPDDFMVSEAPESSALVRSIVNKGSDRSPL